MIPSISVTNSVDVTSGDQTITATVQITNDDTSLDFGNLSLYCLDGNFVSSHFMGSSQMTGGDSWDGTYKVQMNVPQYASAGTWEVRGFVDDVQGNRRDYGGTDEAFPVPADGNFTVVNTGTTDTTPPSVASVSVTPGTIDTGSIAQNIAITLNITDALSGFRFASLSFRDPNSSFQSNIPGFVSFTQATSGDAQDGVYTITTSIPQGSLDGTWNAVLSVRDRAGNSFFYVAGLLGFGDPFPVPFNGQFTVGPVSGTTFGGFTTTNGLTGMDALAGANPDGDVFNNALEFLLGLNPTVQNDPDPLHYGIS